MRATMIVVMLAGALATAQAEPCRPSDCVYVRYTPSSVWYDFGFLWGRLDVGDHASVAAEIVRFAPHVSIGRHFYIGAEADFGRLTGNAQLPTDTLARGTGTGMSIETPLGGTIAAAKAVLGVHVIAGVLSGGAELAAGMRHADLTNTYGIELASTINEPTVEGHGRLDLWIAPTVTIGALAGIDLAVPNNLSFGLVLGLHFARYDQAR